MLYQGETNSGDPESALNKYCEIFPYQQDIIDYASRLLSGIKQNQSMIDTKITAACEHWRLDRITYVDKNILRVGIYEMLFVPDVPPKVSIDEAIELGKKYGNEDSRVFINGVMDRVMREYYGKQAPKEEKQNPDKGR